MIAMVDAGQGIPDQRVVALDFDARLAHEPQERRIDVPRADPVDNHVDPDSRARPLREHLGELLPHFARPVDVGLQADRTFGGAHGLEHRGEELVAVNQGGDLVAGEDARLDQAPHVPHEPRVARNVAVLDLVLDAFSGKVRATGQCAEHARHRHPPAAPGGPFDPLSHRARIVSAERQKPTTISLWARPRTAARSFPR